MRIFVSYTLHDPFISVAVLSELKYALNHLKLTESYIDIIDDYFNVWQQRNFEIYMEHLKECTHFFLIESPDSIYSKWQTFELEYAKRTNKVIIKVSSEMVVFNHKNGSLQKMLSRVFKSFIKG